MNLSDVLKKAKKRRRRHAPKRKAGVANDHQKKLRAALPHVFVVEGEEAVDRLHRYCKRHGLNATIRDALLELVANATPQLAAMNASVILALDQLPPARATRGERRAATAPRRSVA